MLKKILIRVMTLSALLLLAACNSSAPRKMELQIAYDPVTIERFRVFPTVEVDVVPANETTLKQLESVEIDDYFDPDNVLRDSLRKETYFFSEEDNEAKTLKKNAKIWDTWLDKYGASHIVLFANLPKDGAKGPDMRKLALPLAKKRWNTDDIRVNILPAGLMLRTAMLPDD